jgi:hypothetical protein
MAVGEVGHGAIRLGSVSRKRQPAAAVQAPPLQPPPLQAPPAESQPAAVADSEPEADVQAVAEPEPMSATDEPAGTAPFRQGTIKLRKPSGD